MVTFPNAKINLGLYITERRPDGFHNLESVFCAVDYCDVLEIQEANKLKFSSSGLAIPPSEGGNLCLRAYHLLQQDFKLPTVQIHLHKVIPIGAGLGGGSADAAFTLKTLNQLFELKLSDETLEEYARQLGSDCAFFIQNTPRFCYGKGDLFQDYKLNISNYKLLLVYPNLHIATVESYQGIKPKAASSDLREALQQPIETWKSFIFNDFEEVIYSKYPILSKLKTQLYKKGAKYVSMTGSGSCIYGIFESDSNYTGNDLPQEYLVKQAKFIAN